MQKTTVLKAKDIERNWYVVDAAGKPLGRLASKVAQVLRGKAKPTFTPFLDNGDFVVVVNAGSVFLSGRKPEIKTYWRHSMYPGGLRITQYKDALAKSPEFVITHAVKGMLPHNRLGRRIIKKLKVYSGPEHPHQAQQPKKLEI